MKTFNDLEFKPRGYIYGGLFARINFDNGYGVSVITGFGSYTTDDCPYELAILKDDKLCYDSGIASEVIGYLKPQDVTEYMIKIQRL